MQKKNARGLGRERAEACAQATTLPAANLKSVSSYLANEVQPSFSFEYDT